ncbi:MAG TPA: sigma 54-interacting transcriptional regulator, partial [Geobacteraceae bacterium]|nr:sigma 54-interacting transcriptional regulator [Geobacteraceae bacterium]
RVLENQEFERVGGNETIKVDVRVIAATNRSLLASVKEKKFRMDLFYRLRVVSFFLPPLRDRVEDIPLLVNLFLANYSRKYGKKLKGIAPEAMDMLVSHHWEGNIRELKNVINSATVFSKSEMLMMEDFDSFLRPQSGRKEINLECIVDDYYSVFWNILEPMFDRVCLKNRGNVYDNVNMGLEKALIHMAMEKSSQNQVLAAKLLGISRNTLRDRLERYKIDNT